MAELIRLKPQWTPESRYNWNIAPPPADLATTDALKHDLDLEAHAPESIETQVVDTQRVDDTDNAEDDERLGKKPKLDRDGAAETATERRADEFNPLLFKALQGLGRKLQGEGA